MSLRRKHLTRRDFVHRIGRAALALPFLQSFEGQLRAQVNDQRRSKYVVFLYTNDGVHNRNFWPTDPADPSSSPTLSALAPYKSKMLVLGPRLEGGAPVSDTGLTYNARPAQHRASICLSASRVNLPLNDDQFHAVNKIDGPSIDWVIAEALRKADGANAAPFPYLNFGIHPVGGDTPSEIHFDEDGAPIPRMVSAEEVTRRLFGGMMTAGGSGDADADADAELRKHAAVTNFLNARFAALKGELGSYDRQVIDKHLTSLRAFEDRRSQLLSRRSNPGGSCGVPATASRVPTDETAVRTGADTQFLAPFFMQSIATAFGCGMTRVASLSFGYPGGGGAGGLRMPWLGFSDALHSVSHHGNGADKLRKYGLMNAWIASQVKVLLDELAAVPTPGGTLLDETTVYLFNRHGDGNGHTNFALPNVILGGTGGYFKTGHVLALPKTSPTKVLISIAHAMGVDVGTFGSGVYADSAPLPGMTA